MHRQVVRIVLLLAVLLAVIGCNKADQAEVEPFASGEVKLTHHTTSFDGRELAYSVVGQGEPAMVMIHGIACDSTFFSEQVQDLAPKHKLILIDLPGHGRSDQPQDGYSLKMLASSVLAVMTAAEVEKAALAGHSMGAAVARQTALMAPQRVLGLINLDGFIIPNPDYKETRRQWEAMMPQLVESMEADADGSFRTQWVEEMFGPVTSPEVRHVVLDKMMTTPLETWVGCMKGLSDFDLWGYQQVQAPTLSIYAESPDLPPMWVEMLSKSFPANRMVWLKNRGHFFMLAAPGDVNTSMLEFLARLAK